MYYIYILKSCKLSDKLYIGYTNNVVRRLKEHNLGESLHTNKYKPWKIIYLEGYANQDDAKERERQIKHFGKTYKQLKRKIKRSLQS
ncbi:MAG: GIY-YIG nuclease family protein [bacterium]|nr:GIY-YIG nuclease family protein [bacterium]